MEIPAQNLYVDCLIDPSFEAVNIFFVISFKCKEHWNKDERYFVPTVKIKYYDILIDIRKLWYNVNIKWLQNDKLSNSQFDKVR